MDAFSSSERSPTISQTSSKLLNAKRNPPAVKNELPPRQASGAFSTTSTRAPCSRADSAAHMAALPPPTTMTSYADPAISRLSLPREGFGSGLSATLPGAERGQLVQAFLGAHDLAPLRTHPLGGAVGQEAPRLDGIGQLDLENLVDLRLQHGVEHGEGHLDAMVEVPGHPVPGGQPVLGLAVVLEVEDARVLQIAVDDGDGADAVGQAGHAGSQAADAAHDQVDLHAGLARRVQLLDDGGIDEAVHLGDEPSRAPRARVVGLPPDALDEAVAQVGGSDQQVVEAARLGVAGEHVEQLGQVLADRLARREEAEVGVHVRCADVVV